MEQIIDEIKNEILSFVLKDINENTFNIGVEKGSFQFIYANYKNQ